MLSSWHYLFIALALVWVITEVYILGVRNQRSGRTREGDERRSSKLLVVLLSAALLLPMLLSGEVREIWLAPMDWARRVGVVMMLAGWALRVAAVWTLGSAWSRDLGRFAGEPLRTHGIYAWIRHPSYSGFILTALGVGVAWPHPFIALPAIVVPAAAFGVRIQVEEKILLRLYGEDYARYCARSWRLVPFLY